MQLLLSLFIVLLLSYNVLAAPTPTSPSRPQRKGRSFKVDRVRQGAAVMDGQIALSRSYSKFKINTVDLGIDLLDFQPLGSDSGQNVAESDQSGEVTASSVQGDAQFISPVTIGGQKIVMNFDTGSADLYVLFFSFGLLGLGMADIAVQLGNEHTASCRPNRGPHHLRPLKILHIQGNARLNIQHHLRRRIVFMGWRRNRHSGHRRRNSHPASHRDANRSLQLLLPRLLLKRHGRPGLLIPEHGQAQPTENLLRQRRRVPG